MKNNDSINVVKRTEIKIIKVKNSKKINAKNIPKYNSKNNALSDMEVFSKIQKTSLLSLFWFIFIITIVISIVLNFINFYRILSRKWSNKEVNKSKYIWALLTIFIFGPFASLAFTILGISRTFSIN